MAKKEHYFTQFENNKIYHVYNRTVDNKPMFLNDENYKYFIKQFDKYLLDYIEIFAYNLPGNHFHFLIKIIDLDASKIKNKSTHEIVSHQFKKIFSKLCNGF